MEAGTLIGYALTALGAGGLGEVIRQIRESNTRRDAVQSSSAQIALERDKYGDVRLQQIIDNLVKDNESMRAQRDVQRARADASDELAQHRLEQIRALESQVTDLRRQLEDLQRQLHDFLASEDGK